MKKDKMKKIIITLITIILILVLILIGKIISKDKKQEKELKYVTGQLNSNAIQKIYEGLSNNEIKDGMNQLKNIMEKKTNASKIIVNGEEVSEKEIAYMDFIINNTLINENQEKKDAISEIIKEYAIAQDAKKKNIKFTYEENKIIETRTRNQFSKDKEGMNDILNLFQMSYDEFLKFYTDKVKRLELQTRWTLYISNAIKNGKLYTDFEAFNNKCKQYNKIQDTSQQTVLLLQLIDEYKEYLKEKAVVKYIN